MVYDVWGSCVIGNRTKGLRVTRYIIRRVCWHTLMMRSFPWWACRGRWTCCNQNPASTRNVKILPLLLMFILHDLTYTILPYFLGPCLPGFSSPPARGLSVHSGLCSPACWQLEPEGSMHLYGSYLGLTGATLPWL